MFGDKAACVHKHVAETKHDILSTFTFQRSTLIASVATLKHFLKRFAYVIDRDAVDFTSNFQKHPYGNQVAKKARQVTKMNRNSPNLVVKNDVNLTVSLIFRRFL
ncbi:hypothetical protein TNCV_2370641 [Trichonephila clavipes]|nr:hypothetical protein TNCV_2370641 [Trichonephila clavipes]